MALVNFISFTAHHSDREKMFGDIPYFPDAYIPLFEKNTSYTSECNEILNKIIAAIFYDIYYYFLN